MQCRFSFKHMKTSEALIDYAEAKITQKIEKFSTKPIEAHVTFSVEGHEHIAHCGVTGGDGFNFQVDSSCADMYGSVDLLLNKLEVQLKKQKEKLKQHKRPRNLKQLELVEYVSKDDCDSIPIDADDLIKFERAKARVS
ncbi:MAG: ribosome-associated translation inhibitor RaiA [Oligoflexales bacterium]|nr:ribosome-associated translation inhibitor RaiA [Oligoflexales bacterium]